MAYEINTSQNIRIGVADPYQVKVDELGREVKKMARDLQSKTEERDEMLREVNSLRENKALLIRKIEGLERQKLEEISSLSDTLTVQKSANSSHNKEVETGKMSVASSEEKLVLLGTNINKMEKASRDFTRMASQVSVVRERYISSRDSLDKIETKSKATVKKTDEKLKELAKQESYLKEFQTQMEKASRKLHNFSAVVKENVKTLNSLAKDKDLNLRFGLPPDKIVEIPFDENYKSN